MYRDKERKIYL